MMMSSWHHNRQMMTSRCHTDRGDSTGSDDDGLGGSVLQAKLEQLAVQIGYAGMVMASLTVIVLVVRFCISTYSQRYGDVTMTLSLRG
jgi:hypothetical protein